MSSAACPRCGLAHGPTSPCPVAGRLPALASAAPLTPGAQVGGRFRIEGVAHRSSMSTVYRATDLRNPRSPTVALKEFSAAGLPPEERGEALAWLAREAGLLSTLDHPRTPELLAAFSEGDRHYVAMPFLEGITLEELVTREGPIREAQVLGWGAELADLLTYLHDQEPPVIYRDLKPANILLRPRGEIMLLDLGVARPLVPGAVMTAVGTPGYAPPEQYQGIADERSDLYALGATLHRLLTAYNPAQEAPFRHPPAEQLNPDVSPRASQLVASLLEVAPSRRPEFADDVASRLRQTLRAVHCAPLLTMYRQMLLLLVVAVIAGAWLSLHLSLGARVITPPFSTVTGAPVFTPASDDSDPQAAGTVFDTSMFYAIASTTHLDPLADTGRLLLILAPAALCFLPLLRPRLRAAMRRDPILRGYRDRAAWLLLCLWILPLGIWLLDLSASPNMRTAAAGQPSTSLFLALGAAVLAAGFLQRQRRALAALQFRSTPFTRAGAMVYIIGALLVWVFILLQQGLFFGA